MTKYPIQLTELNSKEIKIKVDEASINSIKAEITQLVTQITEAAAKLNVVKTTKETSSSSTSTSTKSQYQEASKAIKEYYSLLTELSKTETDITKVDGNYVSPSGKWEKLAASLNRVAAAFETLTGAESRNTMTSDEQAKLTQQLAAAEDEYQRKLEASTNKSEEAAARKEREAAAAEEAARAKREEAEAVKAAKAAQEEETRIAREAEAERKAAEATIRNYNNAVVQGESAIKRWSAAEHSRSKSSRDAYKKLIDSLNNLKSAESQYGSSSKEVAEATSNFKRTLKETQAVLISNGDATQSLTTKFGSLAKKFGSKKMVSTAKEIDYALTQLKIVTNATDNEMKQFADTAITLSKNLGKSVTELTKSIETFSRLGYSLKDASELAKYATIMSNVAGVGAEEATTGLTAIVKGFNLDVSQAEHVADILVDVGQKYAVSAGEMMEAYEKSGAALSATNTSLEKSAGLIAAANASVQDASVIGTALKTVSARVRGSKSDLEELGENTEDLAEGFSKYAKEIKALTGFDIMIDETHFKDLYDIMEGISKEWDKLSDTQQARVAEILGGTRQLQVISSIIGNWKDAAGAYETAINSAGASSKANAIYMESVTAHLDQMKAAFEELSTNVMNSGFTKFIIDTGKTILEILNNITKLTGSLGTILIGGAIYKGVKSIA